MTMGCQTSEIEQERKKKFQQNEKRHFKFSKAILDRLASHDKEANEITHLRWFIDDEKIPPHCEGKFKHPKAKKRATTVKLTTEWVEFHF